jgi:hypothetical protein
MNRRKRGIILATAFSVAPFLGTGVNALEEGGYVGSAGEGNETTVYNFLRHFAYEQYYWAIQQQFTTNNDNRVDAMDFAFFSGHGNQWYIQTTNGGVDLKTAGSDPWHWGWGDVDLEFIAFEACKVVPSPIEVGDDWWWNWVKPDGVFDGLHQALGFHTYSYFSTDQDIADYFGYRISSGYAVWQSWFDAINARGNGIQFGAAVMWPPAEYDTYYSFVADPPIDHTWLKIWWQH